MAGYGWHGSQWVKIETEIYIANKNGMFASFRKRREAILATLFVDIDNI